MASNDYEVGMTYCKNGKYFIAVDEKTLVTWKDDKFVEVHPYSKYEPARSLSVDGLCRQWDIPMSKLDDISRKYFTPEDCHDANPSYRTAQRRNMNRPASIRVISFPRLAS